MRLILDMLAAVMILGVLAGVVMVKRDATNEASEQDLVRQEVQRFHTQIMLQAALQDGNNGFPPTVDPAWFKGNIPRNALLSSEHPWCEVANDSMRHLDHPRDRAAATPDTAGFWYNPATGHIRARVPVGISDAQALELYNYLNDSNLTALFGE